MYVHIIVQKHSVAYAANWHMTFVHILQANYGFRVNDTYLMYVYAHTCHH